MLLGVIMRCLLKSVHLGRTTEHMPGILHTLDCIEGPHILPGISVGVICAVYSTRPPLNEEVYDINTYKVPLRRQGDARGGCFFCILHPRAFANILTVDRACSYTAM